MAAPVLQSGDTQTAVGTGGSPSVAKPTNLASGNLVLLFLQLMEDDATTASLPTDFNVVGDAGTGANATAGVRVYWKEAGGSEPATYDFGALSESAAWVLTSVRVTGHRLVSGDPVDKLSVVEPGSTGGSSATIPAITPAEDDTLLIAAVFTRATRDFTEPGTMTERWEVDNTGTGGGCSETLGSSTGGVSTGTRVYSWSGGTRYAAIMFNLYGATDAGGGLRSPLLLFGVGV